MKKLTLILVGFLFTLTACGQALHFGGEYIGENGDLIDSANVVGDYFVFYSGGDSYMTPIETLWLAYADSITRHGDSIRAHTAQITALEAASGGSSDFSWVKIDVDSIDGPVVITDDINMPEDKAINFRSGSNYVFSPGAGILRTVAGGNAAYRS